MRCGCTCMSVGLRSKLLYHCMLGVQYSRRSYRSIASSTRTVLLLTIGIPLSLSTRYEGSLLNGKEFRHDMQATLFTHPHHTTTR